jgi:hypothetical protein
MRHGISCPQRNDAQGGFAACNPLQNVVDGAITAAGNDGIETIADRPAHLCGGVGSSASRLRFHLNSGSPEHGRRPLNVMNPVFAPSS